MKFNHLIKRVQKELAHYAERENGRMKFNRYFLQCEIDEVTADCNIGY